MVNQKHLSIYLNDHLAASIAGCEFIKRFADNNRGTPLGDYLDRVLVETLEDKRTLERLMEELGITKNLLKDAAAWLAEKVGRLKLNGQLVGYSDLSRLIELDALATALAGKLALWRSLDALAGTEAVLAGLNAPHLIERAEGQQHGLEQFRREIVQRALGGGADARSSETTHPAT